MSIEYRYGIGNQGDRVELMLNIRMITDPVSSVTIKVIDT